jgi:cytochrome P450
LSRTSAHPVANSQLRRPSDTLPILGNAIRFLQPRHLLFDWFTNQQTQFGDSTYEIAVPSLPPGVVISSPQNIDFALKNPSLVTKGPFFRSRAFTLFGHGIINASGPLWHVQRKAGLRFFSGATLDALIEDVLPTLYTERVQPALHAAAEDGTSIDLQSLYHNLTTSIMGQTAYNIPNLTAAHPFSRAFNHASAHTATRFQNPLYPFTELFTGGPFRASVAKVKSFGLQIVSNAKRRRGNLAFESLLEGNDAPQFTTLIDNLIDALDDPDLVADAAVNFLSAGRDTTAESLTWCTYALTRHPQAMTKLREEVERVFPHGLEAFLDEVTVAELQPTNIPRVMATFYEALRLYPPVPIEISQTTEALTLPDGTSLPKDAVIVYCIWALNRSTKLWGQAAENFRPERWLDSRGAFQRRSEAEFAVFNGGPRACLGRKMAEL